MKSIQWNSCGTCRLDSICKSSIAEVLGTKLIEGRYEIHSAVFLYKAHALGAISSGKYSETSSLITQFVETLKRAATNEGHIAYRYAMLIERLWFRRPAHAAVAENESSEFGHDMGQFGMGDPLSMLPNGLGDMHTPSLEEMGFGNFEGMDTIEGLFSMSGVFPWDTSGAFVD